MPNWKKVIVSGSEAALSSLNVTNSVTASIFSGSFTGSLAGTASWANNAISASYALTASFALNGGGGGGGGAQTFTQTTPAVSWSFTHNLGTYTPIVQVYDSSYNTIQPATIVGTSLDITTITFATSTSGYAIISTGGSINISGSNATLIQSTPATTWSFYHGLNETYPVFTIFDNNDDVIVPLKIHADNANTASIYFTTARTGTAVAANCGLSGSTFESASWAATASFVTLAQTASFVTTAQTASYVLNAQTASYVLNAVSASFASNAAVATLAQTALLAALATTASFALNAATSSVALNANFATSASFAAIAGFAQTASFVALAQTASFVTTAQTASFVLNAVSASYASNGGVTQIIAGPNITVSPLSGKGQVTISSAGTGSTSFNTATGSYGSFYDTTTQTNPVANVARSMSFNETAITNGVLISGSSNPFNTYIKTENPGVYDIQFSAQIDKTDSGADEIVIWLAKNGTALTDTATTLTLTGNNDKQVAAWNWFVNSAANDYYQIIWYSADTDLRILAETAGGGHPGIPSVIATVNRVDQFLSNTGSFSGSFNGSFTGSLLGTASYADLLDGLDSTAFVFTSSFNTFSSSYSTRVTNTEATASAYVTTSGSFSTRITTLETASGSFSTRVTNAESSITSLNSKTGSYATTGSNTFNGAQTVTTGYITLTQVSQSLNYADDAAAAAGGVPLGGLYRNGNFIAIRIV